MVMDRSDYDEKLEVMLSDNMYSKLKEDPTVKIERQVANKALKEVEDKGEVSREKRFFLTPYDSSVPQLDVLPMVH